MTDFGAQLVPWRGPQWPGRDAESAGDRGERQLTRIINGYVGSGREIRTWPGWKCVVCPTDLVPFNAGFRNRVLDSQRPVARPATSTDVLRDRVPVDANTRYQYVWTEPKHLHSLHRLRDKPLLIGESGIRIEPIMDAAQTQYANVISWDVNGGFARLSLSPVVAVGVRENSVQVGDVVWCQELVDTNTVDAAKLNLHAHKVTTVDTSAGQLRLTLETTVAGASNSGALTGRIGRCRGNRSGVFGANGRALYGETDDNALLDPEALTAWWVEDALDIDGNPVVNVYPAFVANRMRDYGDHASSFVDPRTGMTRMVEGHKPSLVLDTKTANGGSNITATVSGTPWTPGAFVNKYFRAITGSQAGRTRLITANTNASVTFNALPGAIVSGDQFQILDVGTTVAGIPRRLTRRLPFRTQSAVGGDRLLTAAPGYGCLFQTPGRVPTVNVLGGTPSGAVAPYNSIYDRPRALGVTKGILLVPNAADGGGLVTDLANTSGFAPGTGGRFRIAIAYRDDSTKEIGELSEVWEFTKTVVAGHSLSISLMIMHPGYAQPECLANSVMVFMSKVNEDALNHVFTFQLGYNITSYSAGVPIPGASSSATYGLETTIGPTQTIELFYLFTLPAILATNLALYNPDVELPEFRTMPRGAKFVSVNRGSMVSGGGLGETGSKKELRSGQATDQYLGAGSGEPQPAELIISRMNLEGAPLDPGWFLGNNTLPSAYGGINIFSPTLWPFPLDQQEVDRVINCHVDIVAGDPDPVAASNNRRHAQRLKLVENPHRFDGTRDKEGQNAWLMLFRGQAQLSELGEFGVTLSFSAQIIDAEKDEDLEAAGEFRGISILCTLRQTFTVSWQRGPAGAAPFTVTSEAGCNAPRTFVQGDTMTAWISERGPVAYNVYGQPQWIGKQIARDFRGGTARFLRDRAGLMRHAFAVHDEGRGLLLFGVFENRLKGTGQEVTIEYDGVQVNWDNASDEARSRFPCDTILAYSEQADAWSEWQPPAGMEVFDIAPQSFADGRQRLVFVARDRNYYAFDDDFADCNQEPLTLTVSAVSGASITLSGSVGQAVGNRGGLGSFARIGADVCVFATDGTLRGRSTVLTAAGTALVTTAAIAGAAVGDKVLIGARSLRIETTYFNAKGPQATAMRSATARLQPRSRITRGLAGAITQPVWAAVTDNFTRHPSGRQGPPVGTALFHANRTGGGDYMGSSDATGAMRPLKLHGGSGEGFEHKVTLEFFGGAQACLTDLVLEPG